jgi:hypothetical protein
VAIRGSILGRDPKLPAIKQLARHEKVYYRRGKAKKIIFRKKCVSNFSPKSSGQRICD